MFINIKCHIFIMIKKLLLFLIFFLSLVSGVNAVLTDNNEAYYTLDNVLTDSTGNGNTLTNFGASQTPSGKINQAFDFINTQNDFMISPVAVSVSFTFSLWFNGVTASNSWFGLVSTLNVGGEGISMRVYEENDGDNRIVIQKIGGGSENVYCYVGSPTCDVNLGDIQNVWNHIVGTFDTSTNTLKLYFNGVFMGSTTTSSDITHDLTPRFGKYFSDSSSDGWDGRLDEIGYWERAITQSEVTTLYNGGVGLQYPYGVTPTPSLTFTDIIINPTGTYSGINFDISAETTTPTGITFFESHYWVTSTSEVFKYFENGTYTGFSFNTTSVDNNLKGITGFDGHLYIVGDQFNKLLKYIPNGTFTGLKSDSITGMTGVTFFDNEFWVSNDVFDRMISIPINFNISPVFEFIIPDNSTGVTHFNDSFWITTGDTVYKFLDDGTDTGFNFSTSSEDSSMSGIASGQNRFRLVGSATDRVYDYLKENNVTTINDVFFQTTVLNTLTNGNVNTSYSLNGAAFVQICTNNLTCDFNLTLSDNFYNISFQAINNETNVSSSNFSFLVDTTPPTIEVLLPLTTDSYEVNFSNVVNVTDNLSGVASCTINITYLTAVEPDSNFLINCTDTQTFTRAGFYQGFLETFDNAGNRATLLANGTINPIISIFFNATNGPEVTNYTATVTDPFGDITQLLINTNNPVNLSPIVNGTLVEGDYIIQFEKLGFVTQNFTQTVNATNAGINVTFFVDTAQIIVNIFNRETGALLTQSTDVIIFTLGNITTSTGQAVFQDFNFLPGGYSVEAVSDGFYTEEQSFTYSGESNAIINLFLLELNLSNTATLIVPTVDEWDNVLAGVDVRLQEYDQSIFGFKQVSQCISNSNGECQFLIEQSTKSYRIIGTAVINGITYTATNPILADEGETFLPIISGGEEVLGQEIVRQLRLKISGALSPASTVGLLITAPLTQPSTIVSETNISTIINIPVDFIATNGLSYTVCLEVYVISGNNFNEVISPICITGASGILPTADITLNNDFSYEARITTQFDTEGKTTYRTYRYESNKTFAQILEQKALVPNVVMFLWVTLLAFSIYLRNLALWSWGAMFLAVWQTILFANLLVASSSVIIVILSMCVLYISKRQVDLQ